MQTSDNKSWERFIDKAMQEAGPEQVSDHFTESVLAAIEIRQETTAATSYKAPISRLTWIVLGFVFAGVILWSALAGISTQWDWASKLSSYVDVSGMFEGVSLPTLQYSTIYSIGFFSLFVILQLVFMKRFFDRRLGLQ